MKPRLSRKSIATRLPALALLVLLAAVWLSCRPGLSGGFLFDDYANLPALGASGPIDSGAALARYLSSGTADPTGRPIALASFLLDAQDWPADPRPFKRDNLLLHLLNTTLLCALLLALGRRAGLAEAHAQRAALLGAAFWALHPLFISTTFYIVQREAMLPATFVLAGLLVWLAGRRRLLAGHAASGVLLQLGGLGVGTLLATLSKANGALLPLFALLIEHLLLRPREAATPGRQRWLMRLLGGLPSLVLLAYLAWTGLHLLGAGILQERPWTEAQRLLSEPRVLWDYLRLLWLPHPYTPGLFNDQIRASTGWLQPWTTLPALLGLLALAAGAWGLRRRLPLWSFAVLFYLAGQLVESSTIPIELYFEHRNYLPAMPLFWPLAVWLSAPGGQRVLRGALTVLLLAGLVAMTHARATLWGNTAEQGLLWARLNPASPRAQAYAAQILMQRGRPDLAAPRLRALLRDDPGQVQLAFNLLGADCALGGVDAADLAATADALRHGDRLGRLPYQWLGRAIDRARGGACHGLDLAAVAKLIRAAQANRRVPDNAGWQQDLLNLRARLALARGDADRAASFFAAALRARPTPATALEQAAQLAAAGHPHRALSELALYHTLTPITPRPSSGMPWLHHRILAAQHYWPREFAHLRRAIEEDLPAHAANRARPDREQ